MIGIVMIVIGVFVSNERDREMRGSSAQGAELDSLRCNSSFRESRTIKRNYSQLSGRTWNDPPPRTGLSTKNPNDETSQPLVGSAEFLSF